MIINWYELNLWICNVFKTLCKNGKNGFVHSFIMPYKSGFLTNEINQFALHCCKLEFPPCLNKSSFLLNIFIFLIHPTKPLRDDLFIKLPGTPRLPPEIRYIIKGMKHVDITFLNVSLKKYINDEYLSK